MIEIRKLAPGDRILDYRILERLGAGGFGEVFRAEHEVLGRVVAIKVPRDLEALAALRLEGVIQAKLDHPGIVRTLEISISHDPPYVVMEYVDGASLQQIIAQGPLPWRKAVGILVDVCDALDFAHKSGVIHGDIKPGNILIPADGKLKAKVTDFGLSRIYETGGQANLQISRSLNYIESASQVVGTLRYLAPEVQRGEGADVQSDVYSVGILLFELLTGMLPEGREVPSEVKKNIPEAIDDIFNRCYARKNRRLNSLGALRDELKQLLETGGATKPKPEESPATPKLTAPAATSAEPPKRPTAAPLRPAVTMDRPLLAATLPTPSADERRVAALEQTVPMTLGATSVAAAADDYVEFRNRLKVGLSSAMIGPANVESVADHGFDCAFGVTSEGDPQHRVFTCVVPFFDAEAAQHFVTHGTRVFELEKGLWEKEVTFVIATHELRDREKVDWALRSFASGWWRRRRVLVYDLTSETVLAQDYGCDPIDNELKKSFLDQLRAVNRKILEDEAVQHEFALACQQRSHRLGTALALLSSFCLLAIGIAFNEEQPRPARDNVGAQMAPSATPAGLPAPVVTPKKKAPERRTPVQLPVKRVDERF